MINTKELRLGNIVNEEVLGDCIINGISDENVSVEVPHMTAEGILTNRTYFISNNSINPIPLTEEWLKAFALEKVGQYYHCKYDDYRFAIIDGKIHCSIGDDDFGIVYKVINYVHEFQNLCFALTNEELTLQA